MYHELSHFNQNTSKNTSEEVLISNLSSHLNVQYYKHNWSKLPHEIDAEFSGVMSMWSQLNTYCPNYADELMFDYLTTKATTVKYMIDVPEGGFKSKEQVETLFETVYDDMLNGQRKLPYDFLRFNDDISNLLTTDDGVLRMEYEPFYRQLAAAKTGQELDIKMASLVSYIHPELQELYPELDFIKLSPLSVFGISMPETPDEVKTRIDSKRVSDEYSIVSDEQNNDDFIKAVENIPIEELIL